MEMDWTYIEERRWKHHQSCKRVKSTGGNRREGTQKTELEPNLHDRTEGEKHHVDGMTRNRMRWKALVEDLCST